MMRRGRAVKHLVKCLLPVVEQRMKSNTQGTKPVRALRCTQLPTLRCLDRYSAMDDRLIAAVKSLVCD